ncbi:ABC transporter ATP-binding protein [Candidatus Woesearchaeota archaeon]|nr:ABC transporter ATP-binding protein [Candidatus Woesearchaeota archaeon]
MSLSLKKYQEIDLKHNLKTLWGFVSKYKLILFSIIGLMFVNEGVVFLDNFIFKYLVDKGTLFTNNELSAELFAKVIIGSVLVYLGLKVIDAVLWYFMIHFTNRLESKMMSDIEKKSFWHILKLSYRFHLNKKTGTIISQFTRGINKVETFADAFLFHFVKVFFRIILAIGVIFYFDLATALTLLAMIVVFVFVGFHITNLQKKPQNIANYREDVLKQNLSDVFLNIETVKYFAKEKSTQGFFSALSHRLRDSRYKFWNYFSWHAGIQTMVLGIGISLIFYFSFTGLLTGRLTLGTITLIYAAVWKLIPNLFGLIHGYRQFVRSIVDVDALFKMFKEENEVKDLVHAKKLKVDEGEIVFKNVTFTYPVTKQSHQPKTVIKNFDYKVKKYHKVAFVGPSGGGKTTMIKLLYRLFDLSEGKILIDGQDISKITQESLRDNMSVVPQEPLLFDNSLWYNIAYANPKASKRQIWKAIKFAQLDKFIADLPNREKTIVGERGVKLSGGEKQRVSIARALLANKKILVLDEATSALDSETEKEIQKDLEKLMKGRTTIMIAHRLSTIMKANEIVVISKGKIVEAGTHKELTNKRGGLYRRLWELQRGGGL